MKDPPSAAGGTIIVAMPQARLAAGSFCLYLNLENVGKYQINRIWNFPAFPLVCTLFHERCSSYRSPKGILPSLPEFSSISHHVIPAVVLLYFLAASVLYSLLGALNPFSLVGGLLREPQPPAAVTLLSLYRFLCFTLSWVPTMPSGSVLSPFQGICWRLSLSLSTGLLTKACHQLLASLTIKYFVSGRCHSYFFCANLAQAIFGKYLSAAWNFASLFLQIICGSLPHFLLNAELNKIRFSINFP